MTQPDAIKQIFTGNSEMAGRMRSLDWSQTSLGSVENWSQSLRSALSICLNSRFPIAIYWGQDCILLYNDAWRPIVGDKHSWALDHPAREVWSEIWDDIGSELAGVLATGEGTFHKDDLLSMHRFGYTEECFFEYTFNPIQGEGGVTEGVFNVVSETTYRVLSDRRARLLREVASKTGVAKTAEEACALMLEAFESDRLDIPLALLYLVDSDGKARLCQGMESALESLSPAMIDLTADDDPNGWPIAAVFQTARPQEVKDLVSRFGVLSGSPWSEPPQEAMVLPIAAATGQDRVSGVLVVVASPRRRLDEQYRDFFAQVAGQVALAIANARSYEAERKRAETLAEIDRAKTVFFSNVSHEFRTPLTLMLSPLEELSDSLNPRLQPNEREQLQLVQRNGLRLQKLVNTLLDFSRIEAGRIQASYEPTDLATYTAELASTFRSLIERAGMILEIDCSPISESVYVDREMWEKIVFNLLSNAFKFTFTGSITVRLRGVGDAVALSVKDTGVGIPEAELPRLFERFHRISGTRARTYEGSGIGLSLVQELVKLHTGAIEVKSVEGKGSCFTVTIPTGINHLPQDRIGTPRTLASTALGANAYLEEALRWLPETNEPEPITLKEGELCSPSPRKNFPFVKILVVDDNADMRDYVGRLLSQQYEVEAVSDGLAALAAVRQQIPDLILTDVMMPNLDGFGLLQALRSEPQTREIPIILLSARAGEESKIEGLAAGADDYLIKPFSARELLARIEATLKLAQLRREAGAALRESEEKYRTLFESIDEGFCVIEMIFDDRDRPLDYRFLIINPAFDKQTGKADAVGKTIREIAPQHENYWFEIFGKVAITGESVRCENYAQEFQRWYEIHAFRVGEPELKRVGILFNDISDRKIVEAEREQLLISEQAARETAEQANRIKDEFLAVLSHELRSPLNPILGWTKLLQTGKLDAAKTAQALATIERNAKLQADLIEDLLDVSRILRGKLSLNISSIDLASTIQAALETVRLAAEAKSIQIETNLDSNTGRVSGDPTRLQQVVWNLLSNAVKFTPAGGRVEVKLAEVDRFAQITISDTGKGIQPEFVPHVFDYFRQEDGATTRKFGGLGLGLAIVRHLVELHGGTVAAESEGEGKGATFMVKLPLMPVQGDRDEDRPFSKSSLNLNGVRVLVVDDEVDSLEFIAFVLEMAGARVTTAKAASEGFSLLIQSSPDVLLSDIGMPDLDGYMFMRQVRTLPLERGGGVKAIALTAYAGDLDRQQALKAGFQEHLSKPVEPEALVRAISALIRNTGGSHVVSQK